MTHPPANPDTTRRIILFGSETGYSRPVLDQLLLSGVHVEAVILPASEDPHADSRFPISLETSAQSTGLSGLATARGIPLYRPQTLDEPQLIQQLNAMNPENGLVACFPMKLPAVLTGLPSLTCWNLHPSLLPAYRGPTPLYWQIHLQETHTGLTLHEVTDRYDAGNIIAQRELPLPEKCEKTELDNWVAEFGVALFVQSMDDYLHDRLAPIPQDETLASYYPWPE